MKVCVLGAGAVGGHLAAKLARGGLDVSIVARGPHLQAVQRDGLTLRSAQDAFTVRVKASDNPADLGPQDVVITALKAHSLPAAAPGLEALLGPDTPVVYAVNGIPWWYFHGVRGALSGQRIERLDPGGVLAGRIGAARAIGAVIRSPNEVVQPGVIASRSAHNSLVLGELDGVLTPRLTQLCEVLGTHYGTVTPTTDIRAAVWEKLVLNVVTSPLSCLSLATSRDISNDPDLVRLFRRLVDECIAVAAPLGVSLTPDVEALLAQGRALAHRPSMLQDLLAGRPLEIDAQLLAVRDIARMVGVDVPTMDTVFALMHARARSRLMDAA